MREGTERRKKGFNGRSLARNVVELERVPDSLWYPSRADNVPLETWRAKFEEFLHGKGSYISVIIWLLSSLVFPRP